MHQKLNLDSAMHVKKKRIYKVNESLIKRNEQIREDFHNLKKEGVTNRNALIILADKYFLSEHTVNSIVYSQN